jgi:hypothetical protein
LRKAVGDSARGAVPDPGVRIHRKSGTAAEPPLSAGSGEQVALQYSGAAEGKPLPMMLEMVVGSVNRGACIRDLSQYPKEVEYLFPPVSFISPNGRPRLVASDNGLSVRVIDMQVNINLTSSTVEQQLGQKKRMHCTAFRYLLAELKAELARIAAQDGAAEKRLAGDTTKNQGGAHTVEGLLEGIARQFEAVMRRQEAVDEGRYADDAEFRAMVGDMLDARSCAVSKLRVWLEDRAQCICFARNYPLRTAHRLFTVYLTRMAGAASTEEGRRGAALEACKARGLLRARVDEANGAGESPLFTAAADGATAADIRLLIAAGCAVNGAAGVPSAAAEVAARFGHVEALGALLEAKAAVNASAKVFD